MVWFRRRNQPRSRGEAPNFPEPMITLRPPTAAEAWVSPSFSLDRAAQVVSKAANVGENLVVIVDWKTLSVLYLAGSSETLFNVTRENFCKDPSVWQASVSDYDRAAMLNLKTEVEARGWAARVLKATGGDGMLRTLRCLARKVEVEGQVLLICHAVELEPEDAMMPSVIMRREIEVAHVGVAVTDPGGIFIYLNQEHINLFGYSSATELVGQKWSIFYTPEAILYLESVAFPALAERGVWKGRVMAKRKNGSLFHEELSLTSLPGGGIVCNCSNVSDDRTLAEQLRKSEELFRTFLNTTPTGVLICPIGGNYEFVNRLALKWFGSLLAVPTTPGAGARLLNDHHAFEAWHEADRKVLSTGERQIFDFPWNCDGQDLVFEVDKCPLSLGQSKLSHICTLVRGVTEQRRLEKEAEAMARHRDELNVMQREFISMVSHEFRTPMTSIQGVHYLLSKKTAQLPSPQVGDIERLLGLQGLALSHLKELVDQVLLLNRMEQAAPADAIPPTGVAEFFSSLINGLNLSVATNRVLLELDLPVAYEAQFDAAKVRVACDNLISNALKYSAEEHKVRVKVRLAPPGWCFSVTDQGRGIPAADQAKLFKPFHRASNVQGVPGTGLGLAIVRRAVDFHAGSISFTSAVGVGSEFLVTIPAVYSPAGVPGKIDAPAIFSSPTFPTAAALGKAR